jgi:transposase
MKALVMRHGLTALLNPVGKSPDSLCPEADWNGAFYHNVNHKVRAMKTAASSPSAKRRARNARKLKHQGSNVSAATSTSSPPRSLDELTPVHRRAAGIDVGSVENYVAIPADGLAAGQSPVRVFGVLSAEQDALVEWLRGHQITTVAMEATGIYWLTLYDKLEAAGIEVYLVDPHGVKAVPGRKSDWLDCQWLQKLHTYGLLHRAFRPDPPIRRLRTLTRQRAELVLAGATHLQHMGKALTEMNLHLQLVVSDLHGDTALRIIDAILAGKRDPQQLVQLRDERCRKSTVAEMEAGLTGTYDEEHLLVLQQSLDAWRFYQKQMAQCDQRIQGVLAQIPTAQPAATPAPPKPVAAAQPAKPLRRKRTNHGPNASDIDFSPVLARICGVDLVKVCGLNLLSVLMLIGEIGTDMSRWRNARAFCSWLGLCPASKISGGKVLSRRTRKVNNRASTILRLAAMAVGKTDTWLGHFYRRIRARRGAPKAITATARKLACIVYHMIKYGDQFALPNLQECEAKAQAHRLRRLRKEANSFGFELKELQQDI